MRTYKPTYRGHDGKTRAAKKFYAELHTAAGRVLRLPGFTSERLTESLGRNAQRLIDCRASGETLPQDAARWVETLPHKTVKVLSRWGHALAAGEPLSKHVADWKSELLARGNTAKHADLSANRVGGLFESCRWMMRDRRATSNPVEYLDGQNAAADRRHIRRMLSPADMAKLLTAAQAGPERYGMSGQERAFAL